LSTISSVIEEFEEIYNRGFQKDFDYSLTHYTEEKKNMELKDKSWQLNNLRTVAGFAIIGKVAP